MTEHGLVARLVRETQGALGVLVAFLGTAAGTAGATETVLHTFVQRPAYPYGGVARDSNGNLYGTASTGGPRGNGVVYRVDTTGHQTVRYSFTGGADGGYPYAGVIRDTSGNLYGTTLYGGGSSVGVVYKVDTAGNETVLHSFGGPDGANPYGGVIRDSAGNLYGTTYQGGASGYGEVFKLDTAGTLTVLYSFTDGPDGGFPQAGVIRDSAGNLYGTTHQGGGSGAGVVYKVDTAGNETVLHSFSGPDGAFPYSEVFRDGAGNLYGTTYVGGASYNGVVYKVDTAGKETVLHSFTGGADGGSPYSGVIRDSAGNLYGTTSGGSGGGVVFKMDKAGNETVLHSFGGADGAVPYAAVISDTAGNLYGTTNEGGGSGAGVVFEVSAGGQETVLFAFPGGDGTNPQAGVIRDSSGNLYGTTYSGGRGAGTVYKRDAATGHEMSLYSFTDGGSPVAGVILDSAGNLYGTTLLGGPSGYGAVFKLDTTGNETTLYSFTGGTDGRLPYAGVIRDTAGNLYGTTSAGGASGYGVVFKVDTAGKETVLYSFTGGADGNYPYGGVIRDGVGNLYGTTLMGGGSGVGVVFKVDTTGKETVRYSFTGGADGRFPQAGVIRDTAGNLYGTTVSGGASGVGAVFKVDTTGKETVLYSFTGGADGSYPYAGVIRDTAGNLYGTASHAGASSAGVVYKVDTAGNETVLYSFTGGTDGAAPYAGVIRDGAGNLYGTTNRGGTSNAGVVYRLFKAAAASGVE
jgi:uncharacterized repeat protein (TIGR03803 family)